MPDFVRGAVVRHAGELGLTGGDVRCRSRQGSLWRRDIYNPLGHRSITTSVDLYGHLVPEASGRARDALDKRVPGRYWM